MWIFFAMRQNSLHQPKTKTKNAKINRTNKHDLNRISFGKSRASTAAKNDQKARINARFGFVISHAGESGADSSRFIGGSRFSQGSGNSRDLC
jgi:hypothetical protein